MKQKKNTRGSRLPSLSVFVLCFGGTLARHTCEALVQAPAIHFSRHQATEHTATHLQEICQGT